MNKLYDIRIRGGQHHRFAAAIGDDVLKLGCQLHLRRESDNQFDPNAIAAYVQRGEEGYKIGYMAASQAARYAWRMDQGAVVHLCTVTRIDRNGLAAALDLRGGWGDHGKLKDLDPDLDDDIPF